MFYQVNYCLAACLLLTVFETCKLLTRQLANMPTQSTCGLSKSRTVQQADWSTRRCKCKQ